VGAVIVAAGESRRMAEIDKTFAPLMGRPLISYSLEVFQDDPRVEAVVLVLSARNIDGGRRLVEANGWSKVRDICLGGQRRQDSVRLGVDRLPESPWIIVHDGARPLVDEAMIGRGLAGAELTGAAVAAVPVKDTIKSADAALLVTQTLQREKLWSVQTPQVFRRDLLVEAHERVAEPVGDDGAMIERLGGKVRLFMGSYQNIKVTTPEDLAVAEAILRRRISRDVPMHQ
jgi:2-C-methyl-D-erythritol 4-phosphate cytidylyltransferase